MTVCDLGLAPCRCHCNRYALQALNSAIALLGYLTPRSGNAPGTGTAAAYETARDRVSEAIERIESAPWSDDSALCAEIQCALLDSLERAIIDTLGTISRDWERWTAARRTYRHLIKHAYPLNPNPNPNPR